MRILMTNREARSDTRSARRTRPLTIALLLLFALTWHFMPEIQAFFRGFVFGD